jgi:predicted TIM-barrel fold metal-dependent hydrolase
MENNGGEIIDMHLHVGLVGNEWGHWGFMSEDYRRGLVYKTFLLYARIDEDRVCDRLLREKTLEVIATSGLDKVVCLALDPVYDKNGVRREGLSHFWVDNDYVLNLKKDLGNRILLGASVHPYDPHFEDRVRHYVEKGAVLLKWIPSAQQIDLSNDRVAKALKFLATVLPGNKPFPLLLHVGPEYAIPSTDKRTSSYDFLSWTSKDKISNFFRFKKKWFKPNVGKIRKNIEEALDEGAVIIFAHCGLPYFVSGAIGRFFEHSEFKEIERYLRVTDGNNMARGAYADVSAILTPFRKKFFSKIQRLPGKRLLYGSDFPTPVFELSADFEEMLRDFKAVLQGDFSRIIVPQDNLLDTSLREMRSFFPAQPMFTNFSRLLKSLNIIISPEISDRSSHVV